jgi:hypothetical protein
VRETKIRSGLEIIVFEGAVCRIGGMSRTGEVSPIEVRREPMMGDIIWGNGKALHFGVA